MNGSCLCGEVKFEVMQIVGPFELCHCNRCRKASGSAYASFVSVKTEGYQITHGRESIRCYQAPMVDKPPMYSVWFCSNCGSPVPNPSPDGDVFEIPAGALEGPTPIKPDKHIYVDLKANWEDIDPAIPTFTKNEIRAFRSKYGRVIRFLHQT